jgi:hypothetical protein
LPESAQFEPQFAAEQFLCSDCAQQRHEIIPNRLALAVEESVSGVTGAPAPGQSGDPPMRIYIIGNDGVTLCREPPPP